MQFDYLLYDNRTLGSTGRDWGLKLATGSLAGDRHVRQMFVEHCRRSFDARFGAPRDFGAALGGFPIHGSSYLLCVTLEIQDLAKRPSCGFVGLYCPGLPELRDLLETADPMATALAAYDTVTPPARLEPRGTPLLTPGALGTVEPVRYSFKRATVARFVRSESPHRAAAALRRASELSPRLPSILGIATWQGRKVLASSPEQVIFFQGLPADIVFEPVTEEPPPPPRRPPRRESGSAVARLPRHDWTVWLEAIAVSLLVALCGTALMLLSHDSSITSRRRPPDAPSQNPAESTEPKAPPRGPRPGAGPDELLERIEPLVHEASNLDEVRLQSSQIHRILSTVEVREVYEGQRSAMLRLLETELPAFRSSIFKVNLGFYFTPQRKRELSASERREGLLGHLKDLTLPVDGCDRVRENFRYLIAQQGEEVAIWCQLVEAFAEEKRRAESRSP